jgi:hypothetical protein
MPKCIACDRPAASEYCEDCSLDLKECDCCGKKRLDVQVVWADWVGETYACPKCRGWDE